ncbi:nitroreductase family protein [Bacillus fungorum]|uniref:Nitroreductase family protein n=1 Tax=Bacillus fungorum TaxID=2039284 RepID=A0A2G6QF75_9BACI|nr:nitroreductase family protein [Bacillus fungorum]PIE95010.1 nitroreductase family protein [Bacillus fungorum]
MSINNENNERMEQTLIKRRSIRNYDPSYVISKNEINEIIKIASYAPSAWNLQHWRFLVITTKESKEKLYSIANYQKQVLNASVQVIILGDLHAYENYAKVFSPLMKSGFLSEDIYKKTEGDIHSFYKENSEAMRDDAIRNASLCAMQLMIAAELKGLNTCPMTGFNSEKLVQEFSIPNQYIPVMIISVGKAINPARRTIRLPIKELITYETFENK